MNPGATTKPLPSIVVRPLIGLRSQSFDLPIPDSDISRGIQFRLRIHDPAVQDDNIKISCHEPAVGEYQNAKAGKKHDPAHQTGTNAVDALQCSFQSVSN